MKIRRLTVRLATACAIVITLLAASAGVSAQNSNPHASHVTAGEPAATFASRQQASALPIPERGW